MFIFHSLDIPVNSCELGFISFWLLISSADHSTADLSLHVHFGCGMYFLGEVLSFNNFFSCFSTSALIISWIYGLFIKSFLFSSFESEKFSDSSYNASKYVFQSWRLSSPSSSWDWGSLTLGWQSVFSNLCLPLWKNTMIMQTYSIQNLKSRYLDIIPRINYSAHE